MTVAEIEKELEAISKKMANAFNENLSAEEYVKLLNRKLELMHELFFKENNND